ncbi:seryl-tRNA synthetase [Desulfonauticus submarinus]|uniref:Serine--tRNA ligase n=1 Tax=Desulfonauticus submarinus TaxID=206665 RepID=A0A1H0E297_9BACT|nr:serine--tRNA ligase [Desulfonauticus submarinus]SDN76627.1 seryl-tRNA synthetase [Desulfonauticus submarinus]
MLDLKFVRKNLDVVKEALIKRNMDFQWDEFLSLDEERRSLIHRVEKLKEERNRSSQEVAQKKKKQEDVQDLVERLSIISKEIKELDAKLRKIDEKFNNILLTIPNIPHPSVPIGKDESENKVIKVWGDVPTFNFQPREHWEIGKILQGLDFSRAAKLTGSRFVVMWGWAAKLERALINFMLDIHTKEHGYLEVLPPFIVNADSMQATGQLPKFKEDLFKLEGLEYYLIPTAEVPVINLHRDEVLQAEQLPINYTAYTPCFRSEAGSYGRDTKGIIRQHQFDKVELIRFVHPEDSYEELERLVRHAEKILQLLELPYRVVALCTGDLGFSAAKTYDLEVWLPGQNKYREISSCSNCEDFQARRANIRLKDKKNKKIKYPHILNGSGLAIGRTLVAILENYQQEDGTVIVPKVLKPYLNGLSKIEPRK